MDIELRSLERQLRASPEDEELLYKYLYKRFLAFGEVLPEYSLRMFALAEIIPIILDAIEKCAEEDYQGGEEVVLDDLDFTYHVFLESKLEAISQGFSIQPLEELKDNWTYNVSIRIKDDIVLPAHITMFGSTISSYVLGDLRRASSCLESGFLVKRSTECKSLGELDEEDYASSLIECLWGLESVLVLPTGRDTLIMFSFKPTKSLWYGLLDWAE